MGFCYNNYVILIICYINIDMMHCKIIIHPHSCLRKGRIMLCLRWKCPGESHSKIIVCYFRFVLVCYLECKNYFPASVPNELDPELCFAPFCTTYLNTHVSQCLTVVCGTVSHTLAFKSSSQNVPTCTPVACRGYIHQPIGMYV